MIPNEHDHIVVGLVPAADRYNANPQGDVVSMMKHQHFRALLTEGAGGTGTVKITVLACSNFTPSATSAINFRYRVNSTGDTWGALTATTVAADGYTTVAGANKQVEIFVEAQDLPDGYDYLCVQLTEVVNDPCVAGLTYILSGARFAKDINATVIA